LLLYSVQTKYSAYKGKNMACKFLPSDRKFDDYGHSYLSLHFGLLFKVCICRRISDRL